MQWRIAAALLVVLVTVARTSEAQRPNTGAFPALPPGTPTASVADSLADASSTDDVQLGAKRFADDLAARLRPIEMRLEGDPRLRGAGAAVGLTAAAVGAFRRHRTLTIVGAEAIRLGLRRQLSVVRARTGFAVAPAIGRHGFAVIVSRTF